MSSQLQSLLKQKINENIQAHGLADKDFTDFSIYQGTKLEQLPVDKIKTNTAQPRLNFDEVALDELAQSISEVGLLQPITVRKKDDFYEIIAGERRFRAIQKLGKAYIDCIIMAVSEEENILLALAENLSREDLSDYEIAKSIIAFKSSFPSKTEYAKALGISRQKLYKLFAYEALSDAVLKKLDINPSLISSDIAEQLITLKKNLNILEVDFNRAVSQGLDLIVEKNLKQSKLPDFVRGQVAICPNSDTSFKNTVKKTYSKDGKTIGKIRQSDNKYIVELNNILLSESDYQKIEQFFDALLIREED